MSDQQYETGSEFLDSMIDSFWACLPEETANNLANFKKAGSWSVQLAAGSGNSAFTCEVRERYRNRETLSRVIFECAPTIAKGALHRTYAEQVSAANELRIRSHAAACHPSAEANCRVDKEQSG